MGERRKSPRINVSFPIECRTGPSRNYFYTVSKDLSAGGTRILSNDFLVKNDELKLNINLIDRVLNITARVSWCAKERTAQRYATGLEFLALNETDKKTLVKFIDTIIQS